MELANQLYKFLHGQLLGSQVSAVEVCIGRQGEHQYYGCIGNKKADQIEVERTIHTSDLLELKSFVSTTPTIICLTGRGVISKPLEHEEISLEQLFPGIDHAKTYTKYYTNEAGSWVSLISKPEVDTILQAFREAKIQVLAIELGAVSCLENPFFTQSKPSEIAHHSFKWGEERLEAYSMHLEDAADYQQMYLEHSAYYGIAILQAIGHFAVSLQERYRHQVALDFYKDYVLKRVRLGATYGSLAFFFVALIVNLVWFQGLRSDVSALQAELDHLRVVSAEFEAQQGRAVDNEELFHAIVSNGSYTYAQLLEEIALSVPKDLTLSTVEVHMDKNSRKKQKQTEFDKSLIRVEGTTNQIDQISDFKAALRDHSWSADVELVRSEFDHASGSYLFILNVSLI